LIPVINKAIMKTILVPTDFSNTAQAAVDVAAGIAKKSGAGLILLHVVEDVGEDSFSVSGEAFASAPGEYRLFTMKLIQKASRQLAKAVEQASAGGVKVSSKLRVGDAYHSMDFTITEQKVDLVVMGTHGSSGYEEVMVGSNTEKVVRRSSCPVLSVNRPPVNGDFKSIVYATSLKDDELPFTRTVRNVQEMYDCQVHMVRINTPGMFIDDRSIKEKMAVFAKQLRLRNFTLNVYNDYSEEQGIINFAESVGADMIAMATHGRTGLAHLLNGSIAEGVVNHARRPVLTNVIGRKARKVKA
jgi:nucleotide-binding universal stress UspA family protein